MLLFYFPIRIFLYFLETDDDPYSYEIASHSIFRLAYFLHCLFLHLLVNILFSKKVLLWEKGGDYFRIIRVVYKITKNSKKEASS